MPVIVYSVTFSIYYDKLYGNECTPVDIVFVQLFFCVIAISCTYNYVSIQTWKSGRERERKREKEREREMMMMHARTMTFKL